ncbi:hypothetical protein AB0D49_33515 [Streptomyces sp. NPDC048290]|uniref:hypothetical protein n=1 Tax=Streptomyces sp. NPDC048290 TaxID=3155811 RepID=UPI003418EFEF
MTARDLRIGEPSVKSWAGMAAGGSTAAASDVWIVHEDAAGFVMSPPRARTWGHITPA